MFRAQQNAFDDAVGKSYHNTGRLFTLWSASWITGKTAAEFRVSTPFVPDY